MQMRSVSRAVILKDVSRAAQDVGGSDLPRLPRRQGNNKGRQSVEDLLKLFTIVDERKLSGALPRYVAENLTFVNADSVNVLTMAKNIEGLEQRMKAVEQLLLQSTLHLESDAGTAMNDATLEDDQQEVWRLSKKNGKPPEWSRVVRME